MKLKKHELVLKVTKKVQSVLIYQSDLWSTLYIFFKKMK